MSRPNGVTSAIDALSPMPVRGLELRQGILVQPEFVAVRPGPWQLQLIEDSELHDVSPATGPVILMFSLLSARYLSSLCSCMAIPRRGSCLAWNGRMTR